MFTLSEAARVCGKDRGTLYRWIQKGRLSVVKQDDGSVRIDPAELHRVCPYAVRDAGVVADDVAGVVAEGGNSNIMQQVVDVGVVEEMATLRAENRLLREMADDLRKRLDAESEERRRMTYLLEHKVASMGQPEKTEEAFSAPAPEDIKEEEISSPGSAKEKQKRWWSWGKA